MKRLKILLFALAGIVPLCCERNQDPEERAYAVVTTGIPGIDSSGVMLTGSFISMGSSEIEEFGFIVSETEEGDGKKIPLGEPTREFSCFLNTDITKGEEYHVRSYAISQDYSSYGNSVSFISQGFVRPVPVIHSFAPDQVTDDMEVTLLGKEFSDRREIISVLVDDISCTLLYASPDTIVFKVPPLTEGEKTFRLKIGDKEETFGPVTVRKPVIDDFYPKEGYDGEVVTINGSFFHENTSVFFDNEIATVRKPESTFTSLVVVAPLTSNHGEVNIRVEVSGKITSSGDQYTIKTHQISGISPTSAKVGEVISILGSSFIQDGRTSSVNFFGTEAKIVNQLENELEVIVPDHVVRDENSTIEVVNGLKKVETLEFSRISSWKQISDFPGSALSRGIGVSLNSMGYVGIGYSSVSGSSIREWWGFDPGDESWARLTDFPGLTRYVYNSFAIDDKVYVISVYEDMETGLPAADLWSYDPESDTWLQKASPEKDCVRGYTYQGKAYSQTGEFMMIYDPLEDQWETRDFPYFNQNGFSGSIAAFDLTGQLFWFIRFGNSLKLFIYYPHTDSWSFEKEYPDLVDGGGAISFIVNDKGYFSYGSAYYEFDPSTLELYRKESIHRIHSGQVAFGIGDLGYIGLGKDSNDNSRKDFWIFDP